MRLRKFWKWNDDRVGLYGMDVRREAERNFERSLADSERKIKNLLFFFISKVSRDFGYLIGMLETGSGNLSVGVF